MTAAYRTETHYYKGDYAEKLVDQIRKVEEEGGEVKLIVPHMSATYLEGYIVTYEFENDEEPFHPFGFGPTITVTHIPTEEEPFSDVVPGLVQGPIQIWKDEIFDYEGK